MDEDDPIDEIDELIDEIEDTMEESPESYPLLRENTDYSDEVVHWFVTYTNALNSDVDPNTGLPITDLERAVREDLSRKEGKAPEDVLDSPDTEEMELDLQTEYDEMIDEGILHPYDVAIEAAERSLEENKAARKEAEDGNIDQAHSRYDNAVEYLSDAVEAADALFTSMESYFNTIREEVNIITKKEEKKLKENLDTAERNFQNFSTFYANSVVHAIEQELGKTVEKYLDEEKVKNPYQEAL